MDGVQRRSAEQARVEVALARAEADVEVREAAHGEVERGDALAGHAAVEDEARVRSALVTGEEVDD